MRDARRRRFDSLAVTKLDRLGRSLHHLLTLLGEFEALGIDLISLDDGLDRSTPVVRLFFQIRGAFAEYERSLIRERARAGLAAAKRRGKRLGRKPALRGSATFEIERGLRQGRSIRSLAQELGVDPHTIRRTVQRPGLRRAVA
jgi:DNA invertase Pin-like site-specific DNA recombinase